MDDERRPRRMLAIVALAALIAIAGWIGWITVGAVGPKTGLAPAAQAAGGAADAAKSPVMTPGTAIGGGSATSPAINEETWRGALARAYASAGVAQDGSDTKLAPIDDLARSLLPEAERLLARAPVRRGPGLPTSIPTGTMSMRAPAGLAERARDAPRFADSPDGIPPERVAATLSSTDLPEVANDKSYLKTKQGPVFMKPGQWADIEFEPMAHGLSGLRIGNGSHGEYAIAVEASDFTTIRLNGAMIVPGRFYRVTRGGALINGQIKAHVTIRPLSALPVYVEAPTAFPPSAG
jgi:hypothetical protein